MSETNGTTVKASAPRGGGSLALTLGRIRRQPVTVVAAAFLLLVAAVALLAPLLAPYDPNEGDFDAVLTGPSAAHWLGTDELGRDTLSRLLYGSRIALLVAVGSVGVAMAIGVPLGLLLGYKGGWYDRLGSRALDISDALPGLLVGFAVIAILGRGLLNLMLAIGLIFCMSFARMTRAVALAEREKVYLDAARVAGLRTPEILFRQVLPNLTGPLSVQAAVFMGSAIGVESALSFLGLGLDTETPSWGGMLSVAADEQARQPFLAFPPGLAIILTVLAFNLFSDGVGDALGGARRKPARRRGRVPAHAIGSPTKARPADPSALLEVRDMTVELVSAKAVPLVQGVSLTVRPGEVVGLLGESGSGKSMLARAVLGLLPPGTRRAAGSVFLGGGEITGLSEKELREVRGRGVAVVFQDPMTALSPVHTIGAQLAEPLRAHFGMTRAQARERAAELLARVGVENPRTRLDAYPHQFSGGMAQRVAIALALTAKPRLLIADEATSALDVTTQSQVLDLLLDLRDEFGMAVLMITHDLGVVAETCDRAAVMYAGEIVETGDVATLFARPRHPYTAALLAADPSGEAASGRLPTIPGGVPLAGEWPSGCHFANRCAFSKEGCVKSPIPISDEVRCVRSHELTLGVSAR
ncbi:dipeptide/oligopeptide/nickel ABC transporter permease/ATP-binding protein [Actinocorallia sp. A-T 12471]|uniref:dipeptide/oligopeptide/nickel ABC transporter permease/ATP-binding protein n=1 Tax=Actinocorallia sp. A-T 12471 TaxID=3089813 RepID=UPI0029CFBCED|nr:dipeptide/oligopeptide/nickel ABC transporter permease/ATP-binding protein [Actinocorallia sp. A-T 12471]MDX6740093.1 dipeptide/oligopeptide/nickel ABC transporter permease/ATP-binding protein [Actinocorallia sp. A-T 12471]